jgi:hypothetical protein
MDNIDMIRLVAGVCFAVVLIFLVQRRRKSVR